MVEVKVYTTRNCPYCVMVKDYLKENKIKFTEIKVDENKEDAMEMFEKSGQMSVPVVDIDGVIITGFDRERIKDLLNIK